MRISKKNYVHKLFSEHAFYVKTFCSTVIHKQVHDYEAVLLSTFSINMTVPVKSHKGKQVDRLFQVTTPTCCISSLASELLYF